MGSLYSLIDLFDISYGLFANGAFIQMFIDAFLADNIVHAGQKDHITFVGEADTAIFDSLSFLFNPDQSGHAIILNLV